MPFVTSLASYAACAGTWYHVTGDPSQLSRLASYDNGVAYANSAIRFADIRDGSGQTLLLGERAFGRLPATEDNGALVRDWANWWFSAKYGSTLFWTMRSINSPPKKWNNLLSSRANYQGAVAGSFHPGGANFAFADGSVRFLQDTIDSWPMSRSSFPDGVYLPPDGPPELQPGVRFGVYQALSTRSGGELIDVSDY